MTAHDLFRFYGEAMAEKRLLEEQVRVLTEANQRLQKTIANLSPSADDLVSLLGIGPIPQGEKEDV